jgi:predicted short-subunit dehydrogenase-like oxidoreductase (DUF2520 family)
MPQKQKSVSILGAGRVGTALGRLLFEKGWRIGAVVTLSQKTARAAIETIGSGASKVAIDPEVFAADVILITTPDREIVRVARSLARIARTYKLAKKVILHTNGALDRSVLAPLEKLGAETGSLHPLQTFSSKAVPELKGCICAIEGTPAALRIARQICLELGCIPVVIAPRAKPAYHAAAALAAGHLLAIEEAATRILMAIGFSRSDAVRALLPLTRQTLENFERVGANAAWTGPLARGDMETVREHEKALREFAPVYEEAYKTISRLALLVLRHRKR